MEKGFISVDRKILDWEWYKDSNTKAVFLHCLLKANWKDGNFCGKVIHRGQFITSRKALSNELNLGESTIRTALNRLKSTNEITINSTNKYTVITVVKYDDYQMLNGESNQLINQQTAINQPAKPEKSTTIEQYNNNKYMIDRYDSEKLIHSKSDSPLRIWRGNVSEEI